MNEEYVIRYEDGSEIGPFDRTTIESMIECGEIPSTSEILQIEDQTKNQLGEWLESMIATGAAYIDLAAEDRKVLEKHFHNLCRKGPRLWDDQEILNYQMIIAIPGRKELFEVYHKYEESALLRSVLLRLDDLQENFSALRTAIAASPSLIGRSSGPDRQLDAIALHTKITAINSMREFTESMGDQ